MTSYFVKKMESEKHPDIFLVSGGQDHTDQPAWYFVRVAEPRQRAFLKAVSSGNLDLKSFGEVIESGYGENPPAAIISWMRTTYGYLG